MPRERAEILVKPEGVVELVIGVTSQGQGHETSFAQLVTEWLGVPIEAVRVIAGDTDRVTVGGGAHSGRGMRLGSIVIKKSSDDVIEKAMKIAEHLLETSAADIEFKDGRFTVKGTNHSIGLFDVARAAAERRDLPADLQGPLGAECDKTVAEASFPYGCQVVEVEVDPETGAVKLVNYAAVDDVGRAINPLIIHGQVHGGIAQGVGQALMEHACYDPESGQMLAGSFMDYAMPRASDLLPYATELSECPRPRTRSASARPAKAARCRRSRRSSMPSSTRCGTWASVTLKCRQRRSGCGRRSRTRVATDVTPLHQSFEQGQHGGHCVQAVARHHRLAERGRVSRPRQHWGGRTLEGLL